MTITICDRVMEAIVVFTVIGYIATLIYLFVNNSENKK